jgi:outer membrane biosynthesis protein TonB
VALSDDQKAILRLLSQRGEQGYEDLSALMGVDPAEVHRRAKQAAEQLEGEGIPAPAIPDPPGGVGGGGGDSPSVAKDGESPPGESPPPVEPPPTVPAEPQEPAPEVVHSSPTPQAKPKPTVKTESKPRERRPRTLKEDAQRLKALEGRGLWAILAGVAIVVLFLVFIFVGGDDDSGSDGGSTASAESCETTAKAPDPSGKNIEALAAAAISSSKAGKETTRAVLNPVDGSQARGLAIFGRVKNSLALQLAAEGLPPGGACGYTIWLAASPEKMLPLATTKVKEDGVISAQVEVPVEILAYLANETFGQIAITRTDESQLKASLAKATDEKDAPQYTGTEVLRGSVRGPIVGAAKRIEEEGK